MLIELVFGHCVNGNRDDAGVFDTAGFRQRDGPAHGVDLCFRADRQERACDQGLALLMDDAAVPLVGKAKHTVLADLGHFQVDRHAVTFAMSCVGKGLRFCFASLGYLDVYILSLTCLLRELDG